MPRNIRTYNKLIKPNEEQLVDAVNQLMESVNSVTAAAEAENYKGKPGDIRVNKVANNKYDFYVRGEDGWHRDTNSSYSPVDDSQTQEEVNAIMLNNGTIDNQYLGQSRLVFNLDENTGLSGVASPKIEIKGNGSLTATGTVTLNSGSTVTIQVPLKLSTVTNAGVDTDKFLVIDSSSNVKFRTGAEVLSDIGSTVWEKFDFAVATTTSGSYHFKDVDDTTNNAGLWDATDTDPTSFSYLNVPGQYIVPENCTLKAMYATCTNFSSDDNVIIAIYHGTPNFNTTSDTTLALAGTATTISIGTMRMPYGGNATYDVDLDAGDIVVPTFKQDSGSSKTIRGSLTLKFVTR
tara:strand:+ start:137 stop:1180 length:1044 start_codon:yes stop_codon:yes gene_type:complete